MRATLALLFFISGLAGLVLQTVWTRMMILVFGSTTFAVSTVLTAFMAGLAGGSWLAGRKGRWLVTRRQAVLTYALLEVGIGLYALALPWLLGKLPAIQRALLGDDALSSFYLFALLRFVLVALLLAPPTLAMGATLPVLARAFCRTPPRDDERAATTGRDVGTLYALNTAGAVVGVFGAGFVLLPRWGALTTSLTACVIDLLLGGAALLLARHWPATKVETVTPSPAPASPADSSPRQPGRLSTVALVSIGISGALAMSLEVALTRALSLVIGSSTYAFSLILLCFLVGLSGGAALYARRQTASSDQAGNLAVAYLMAGVTLTGSLLLVDDLPALMLVALQGVALSPEAAFLLKFAIAGLVLLLPALFLGMVFPAVVRIYAARGKSPTETTATVYAANTVGAIVGSFLGGYALVPLLGLQRALELLVVALLALAALLVAFADGRRKRVVVWVVAGLAAAGPWVLPRWNLQAMSAGVFRVSRYENLLSSLGREDGLSAAAAERRRAWLEAARDALAGDAGAVVDTGWEPTAGTRLVWHEEGLTATVGISRTVDQALGADACWVRHTLLVNGKPDASLSALQREPTGGCAALLDAGPPRGAGLGVSPGGDAETQVLSGVLPTLLHPGKIERALVIGWGSGVTVGAMRAAGVPRVTAVELEGRVIDAARYFEPHNGSPRRDAGVRIIADDGRNFIGWNAARYDVVVSEPSNPWMAGCGNLFTREFFELVRRRLEPGGMLLQWLQAYEIAPANVWTILATVSSVFESVHVFAPVRPEADLLLVARRGRQQLDWPRLAKRIERAREQLAQFGLRGPADLATRVVAAPRGVARLGHGAVLNTDDNARIEFSTPRDLVNYRRYSPRKIIAQMRATLPNLLGLFGSSAPPTAGRELCWAMLAAGRLGEAATAARVASAETCGRVQQILARPLTELGQGELSVALGEAVAKAVVELPRDRRAARAEALLDPGQPSCAALWVLGRLHAADDRHGAALTFLRAALAKAGGRGRRGCELKEIHRALARHSHRVGLHLPAIEHARQGLDE